MFLCGKLREGERIVPAPAALPTPEQNNNYVAGGKPLKVPAEHR